MTRYASVFSLFILLVASWALPARAQTTTFELTGNGSGAAVSGTPALDQEGLQMLDAMQKVQQRDYKGAEQVYTTMLNANPQNSDAHLQRGVLRRELKDVRGSQEDARATISLANGQLMQNQRDAAAYHQRGMAYRLLGQYPQAMQDIDTSLKLGGDTNWKSDLRDTALEEKASHGVTQ